MFILPYFLQKSKMSTTGFEFSVAWVFTIDGGASVWQTDEETLSEESILEDYLEPNGFVGVSKGVVENCFVYEVDPEKTNLSDFYMWTDFLGKCQTPPTTCDVWRPFAWVGGNDDAWGWEGQASELSLGKFGSMAKMWRVLNI
jgi:hypothetical protein